MGRYDQAPKLVNKKPKLNGNTIMISNDTFISIMSKKDITPKQALLLVWLIGQADGFGIAKETATRAMGLKEYQGYYKLRRALEKAGYLDVTDTNIIINYDKILEQPEVDPILGKQSVDPILEQRMDDPILGGQEDDPIILGQQIGDPMGQPLDDPMGQQMVAHNIEEHRKTYKGQDKKLGQQKDDPILSQQIDDPIFNIDSFKKESYPHNYSDYITTGEEILRDYDLTDEGEIGEVENEYPEAYNDLVRLGMIKRKEWSF